ncbi:MAG: phage tail tape measure protein [Roseburia sp.]|nr:phage tail tape measure protein [Roseburia sp.]
MGRVISVALRFIDGFTNPSKEAIESMNRMGNEAIRAGKQLQRAGNMIASAGGALTKTVTLPIAGAATAAVKTAADFEASMSKVGAISNASAEDMAILTAKAKEMGATTSFSASESAEAMQYMAMAGWKTQDMTEGIAGIMNLAAASGEDLAATSDIVTDGLTAFGMAAKDSGRFADVMAAASSNANTNVALMGETFKYCASTAGAMGYSIEDISVAIGIMGNAGIKGSMAGTTLKNTIANLAKPSESQAALMERLGISLIKDNGEMKSFAEVMDNLRASFSGLSETEKAAAATTLAGKQSMAGLLTIVNASTEDFDKLTAAINGSSGSAEEMAAKMLDNLNGQLTLLKSATEGIAITIGNKLMPHIKTAVSWVQTAADYINNLSDAQTDNIIKWAGIAAAAGPAIMIFGKVVKGIGTANRTFGAIVKTIGNFGGVMKLLTSPAGIVIGVLAAIALAAFLVIKNWDQVKGFLQGVGSWFKNAFEKAGFSVEGFKNKFISIGNTIGSIAGKISGFCKSIAGLFRKEFAGSVKEGAAEAGGILEMFVGGAMAGLDGIVGAVDTGLQVFDALLGFFTGAFAGNWGSAVQDFKNSLKNIFPPDMAEGLIMAFYMALPIIKGSVDAIKKAFGGVVQDVRKIFGSISTIFKGIKTVIKGIVNGDAKMIGEGLRTMVSGIVDTIANIIKLKINTIKNFVTGALSNFLPESAVNRIAKVFDGITFAVSVAADAIKTVTDGMITVFGGLITYVSGVFTGNWSKAWEGVKTIFKGIFDTFAKLCKTPINAVIGIINSAIAGINKLNISIPDWVPGLGGQTFGLNIPPIPMLYKGTDNWKGGTAIIHDRGGEIVDLPEGTRVYPHDKSVDMARKEGERSSSGSLTINIQKLADNIEVRSDEDIDRIAEELARKLAKIALNTGTT